MLSFKKLKFTIGFLFSALFSWLVFRAIDVNELSNLIFQTDIYFFFVGILCFLFGYSCRIMRWQLMLKIQNHKISWIKCAGPYMASIAANNILPFRAGDILRIVVFKEHFGVLASTALASLIIERILDLIVLVFFLFIAIALMDIYSIEFPEVAGLVLIFTSILLTLLILFRKSVSANLNWLARRVGEFEFKFTNKILTEIKQTKKCIKIIANKKILIKLSVLSLAAWVSEALVFLSVAQSLSDIANPLGSLLAFPTATLATLIPSAPGYVGTFDYFVVQAMIFVGNNFLSATAYALTVHALIFIIPVIIGGAFIIYNQIRNTLSISL